MNKLGTKVLKMTCIITLTTILLMITTCFIAFNYAESNVEVTAENVADELKNVIDINSVQSLINNKSDKSNEYNEIHNKLVTFKNDKNVTYVYIMYKDESNTSNACMLVDGSIQNGDKIGTSYPMEKEMLSAFNGKTSASKKIMSYDYGKTISAYSPIVDSSGKVIAIAGAETNVDILVSMQKVFRIGFILLSVIVLITSILISILFSKKLTANVSKILNKITKMSAGDLTETLILNTGDELQTIAESIENLRSKTLNALSIIKTSTEQTMTYSKSLSDVSDEMASCSQNLSSSISIIEKGTDNQARDLVNVTDFIKQFGEELDIITKALNEIDLSSNEMNLMASKSSNKMSQLVDSVNKVSSSFKEFSDKILNLGKDIEQINGIVNIINGIAAQTNLLALNASIESARVGEAGKGFAVVANEIRKLAEQSKDSSESIATLINKISNGTGVIVDSTELMHEELNSQMSVISSTIESFKAIIVSLNLTGSKIQSVNVSTSNINKDKENILKKVNASALSAGEIASTTEGVSNASEEMNASSQEVAATAYQLSNMTTEINNEINKFKL